MTTPERKKVKEDQDNAVLDKINFQPTIRSPMEITHFTNGLSHGDESKETEKPGSINNGEGDGIEKRSKQLP